MIKMYTVWIFAFWIIGTLTEGREPGYKTILTDKGLEFVSQATKKDILSFVNVHLSNNATKRITVSNVSFTFISFKLTNSDDTLLSDLYFLPNVGLEHRVKNMNVTVDAKYNTSELGVFSYISIKLHNVLLSSIIKMTNENGRLKFSQEKCQAAVSSISVEFVEGLNVALFVNQLVSTNDNLKSFFQNELCDLEKQNFLASLTNVFSDTSKNIQMFDDYYFETAVLGSLNIENSFFESNNSGSILIRDSLHGELPFQIPNLPYANFNESYDIRMSYVFMSNYSLNSLLYLMWKRNQLRYSLSKDTVPNSVQEGYLLTDCGESGLCIGTVVPALRENFPNGSSVEFSMKATKKPNAIIKNGNISFVIESYLESFIRTPNNSKIFFYSSNAVLNIVVKSFTLSDYSGDVRIVDFKLSNFTSSLPGFTEENLSSLMNVAKSMFFEPDLCNLFKKGSVVPKVINFDVDAETSELLFVEDLIYICLNFKV